jgi:uncharacterized protein (DUF2164 family)
MTPFQPIKVGFGGAIINRRITVQVVHKVQFYLKKENSVEVFPIQE